VSIVLDHIILPVNERDETLRFYADILGFAYEGDDGPFAVVRVGPDLTIQIADWGTKGGMHLAFAMPRQEFDAMFARVREAGIEHGDSFHTVGSQRGPGNESGAHGMGAALYFFDPSRHLLEIRHYEG
jgi:catechol 2,3-dioxygenase-like lactoylglutathione lyase family enzyme